MYKFTCACTYLFLHLRIYKNIYTYIVYTHARHILFTRTYNTHFLTSTLTNLSTSTIFSTILSTGAGAAVEVNKMNISNHDSE